MDLKKATYLFQKYFHKTASIEEEQELWAWVQDEDNEEDVKFLMQNAWNDFLDNEKIFSEDQSLDLLEQIKQKFEKEPEVQQHKKRFFTWWNAAAAVLLVFIIGSVFFYLNGGKSDETVAINKTLKNDISPGGNRATLTLSNGKQINLNQASNGILAKQGVYQIIKQDSGRLAYTTGNESTTDQTIEYNTLTTPRGGQYQLQLPDGSKVWLNAASSIKYPTVFTDKERRVEVKGEVYFEIAQNAGQPFKVVAQDMIVDVLGTHFNINTYPDEPERRTTLLEGAVRISHRNESVLLKPGQQVSIAKGNSRLIVSAANQDEVTAWKDGVFHFEGDDMANIMRRISRWYNVEVTYKNGIPKGHYTGVISRNTNLSQVLEVLELSGIHFEIKGRNILVEG